jgi:hypothetical protein|tara:strand:- start:1061 stop:1288 length:228 start_codon:yes stop_codon:yes gene_type:complete
MNNKDLRNIGTEIFGTRWQTRLAKELAISPQHLRKYVSGRISIPDSRDRHIRLLYFVFKKGLLDDFKKMGGIAPP